LALRPDQLEAVRLIEAVYDNARERKVAGSIGTWIQPPMNSTGRAVLDSLLSLVLNGDSRPEAATVRGQRQLYDRAVATLMPEVAAAARAWAISNLNKQELRIGQLLNATSMLAEQLHSDAGKAKATLPEVLPTLTPEEHRKIADSRQGGGATVAIRVRRARYMYAVRQIDNKNLLLLMAHPRGVTLVDRWAEGVKEGREYSEETIEECRAAIRALIGDLGEDQGLIWRLPAAIGPGVASLGRGAPLAAFANAYGATQRRPLEAALDMAGNATLVLSLLGPVGSALGDILDVILSAVGTAVSFLDDLEQDQAATASAFADETERLSKGSRGIGTLLQGAATILSAAALPGAVKELVHRAAGARARVAAVVESLPQSVERADARAVTSGVPTSGAPAREIGDAERLAARPASAAVPPAAPPSGGKPPPPRERPPAAAPEPNRGVVRPASGRIPTGVGDSVSPRELRQQLKDRLRARIDSLQANYDAVRKEKDALFREQRETVRQLAAAKTAGRAEEVGALTRRQADLAEEIRSIGDLSDFSAKILDAKRLLRGTERDYFLALTAAASKRDAYQAVKKIGKDEVFGLVGELEVEHIFPRSRIFLIPGFDRLSWEEQIALFNYRRGLVSMSAEANLARSNIPYASWPKEVWSRFTSDEGIIKRLAEREAEIEAELTEMVRTRKIPMGGEPVPVPVPAPQVEAAAAVPPWKQRAIDDMAKAERLKAERAAREAKEAAETAQLTPEEKYARGLERGVLGRISEPLTETDDEFRKRIEEATKPGRVRAR